MATDKPALSVVISDACDLLPSRTSETWRVSEATARLSAVAKQQVRYEVAHTPPSRTRRCKALALLPDLGGEGRILRLLHELFHGIPVTAHRVKA